MPAFDIYELRARRSDTVKCGCMFLPGRSQRKKQVVMQAADKELSKQVSQVLLDLSKQGTEAEQVLQAKEGEHEAEFHHIDDAYLENHLKQVMEVLDVDDDTKPQAGEEEERESIHIGREYSFDIARASIVSKAMSLERFDCASWSSSAILDGEDDDDEGGLLYFDLPLELIRFGQNGMDSPVNAAFVFEKDLKGVLKHSKSLLVSRNDRHDQMSSDRHVRFSTTSMPSSYPTSPSSSCATPRLRRAKEEFNAFLEAQSA